MHSPHDKFVKESLKNLAVARDFVRAFVPEQICSAIVPGVVMLPYNTPGNK